MPKRKISVYVFLIGSALLYLLLGYSVERHDTVLLLPLYVALFVGYVWLIWSASDTEINFLLIAGLIFRLILVGALPALSDDFYRFVWDGRLLTNGIHPFAELPGFYLQPENTVPGIHQALFDRLNSQGYFTVYPPLAQAVFFVSAFLSPDSILGSVVVMRLLILFAEVGSCWLMIRLLSEFGLNKKNVLIYALNPLVILELTGNLHFEAFVIFFILLLLFLMTKSRFVLAGTAMAASIGAKLIPLIFLPLFIRRLKARQWIMFFISTGVVVVLMFYPLAINNGFAGLAESLKLYFRSFEFNASIYYLVREYGFWTKGYNTIQTMGWKLGMVGALLISAISLWSGEVKQRINKQTTTNEREGFLVSLKPIPLTMMWVLTVYLLFATTVHPWYVTTLVMLSVFTRYRFVIVWSGLIFLTYTGYTTIDYDENLWIVLVEYLIVIGYLVYEFVWTKKSIYQSS